MYITPKHYIRSVLLKESFEGKDAIASVINPLLENTPGTMVTKLSVLLLMAEECTRKNMSLEHQLESISKRFKQVVSIIEEHGIKLPEEEALLDSMVKDMCEEGEMNVTAGIDAQTPRVYTKQSKKVEEEECKKQS